MQHDYTARYRAARYTAMQAREASDIAAHADAAAESDQILDAADAAGVDIDIRAIEDEVNTALGIPTA